VDDEAANKTSLSVVPRRGGFERDDNFLQSFQIIHLVE
jgi:hypothetical protein